jgi:hypothetical protein
VGGWDGCVSRVSDSVDSLWAGRGRARGGAGAAGPRPRLTVTPGGGAFVVDKNGSTGMRKGLISD